MAGGLLNIVSQGSINEILTGNPSKTFFKVTYAKYTNFGMQRFRLDFDGMRELRLTDESKYSFKVKRYGDLLMDTYLVVKLPNIWSPVWNITTPAPAYWSPYDFKWIEHIGAMMISEIEILCGSARLQRYTGQYLHSMVERDFDATKKELFYKMTGHTDELNDPANTRSRTNGRSNMQNVYPSAITTTNILGAEPSIRGRTLYIPLNLWFNLDSRCAFPLVALQYNELTINVTLRPIQDLFRVRDVFNTLARTTNAPYVRPDFNLDQFQMYRFLQTPPSRNLSKQNYRLQPTTWDADVHILATYAFLSKEEQEKFTSEDQVYLVKDIYEYDFLNVVGSAKLKLQSTNGLVSNWMFYLQRNDAYLRNEWSNYTNWLYNEQLPTNLTLDQTMQRLVTGNFSQINQKDILLTMGILLTGEYRENILNAGIYQYIEKYVRTAGSAKDGLYCYNFCLNTDPLEYQPSGAINMSRFKTVELEIATFLPPIDNTATKVAITCNTVNGSQVPVSITQKPGWAIYTYTFNIHIFEERYNVLSIVGGNCGMMYAR